MAKTTELDLNLVGTVDLMGELARRHENIIILREDRKTPDCLNIYCRTRKENELDRILGFNISEALEMLHTAQNDLLREFVEKGGHTRGSSLPGMDSGS